MKPKKLTDLEIAIKIEEIESEETMKQTAVDWMFEQLWETPKDKLNWFKILMEAKEMQKEHIEKAYFDGKWDGKFKSAEEYYQETYKEDE